jgi:hypothetical protein
VQKAAHPLLALVAKRRERAHRARGQAGAQAGPDERQPQEGRPEQVGTAARAELVPEKGERARQAILIDV